MKSACLIPLLLCCSIFVKAQELFVFTEPASNMSAKSIGLRLNNYGMKDTYSGAYNYQLLPEVMWGVSKNIMIHVEAFLSSQNAGLTAEGGSLYLKYRFFSVDEVHNHFRIAALARASFNNAPINQPAIDFYGASSGYEGGFVATKLVSKIAISASISALYANDNGRQKFLYGNSNRAAVNYTLSIGKLMLPKEYTSYNQTNINFMLELLGQTTTGNGNTYFDVAPSVQFIIKSRMRVDVGYRHPIVSKLQRTASKVALLRLEYNIFNAY